MTKMNEQIREYCLLNCLRLLIMIRLSVLLRSLRTASTTIKGMEAIRGLYKKTRKEGTLFGFSVCTEIKVLLGIPA